MIIREIAVPKVRSAQISNRGRKRSNNEDFVESFEPTDPKVLQGSGNLYIVADGVGGASNGERASKFAAGQLLYRYYRRPEVEPGERLKQIISRINNEIFNAGEQKNTRMATTLTAAVVLGNNLIVANVGDSRAYLIRNGKADRITHDHSLVGGMMRNGYMTEAEAQASDVKNRLTRSLGGEPEVQVDIFRDIPLLPGDKILLCTDGLTRYALSEDISRLTVQGSPDEIAQRLISFANRNGGADNVSVILVAFDYAEKEESNIGEEKVMPFLTWDEMETLHGKEVEQEKEHQPESWEMMDTLPGIEINHSQRLPAVKYSQRSPTISKAWIAWVALIAGVSLIAMVLIVWFVSADLFGRSSPTPTITSTPLLTVAPSEIQTPINTTPNPPDTAITSLPNPLDATIPTVTSTLIPPDTTNHGQVIGNVNSYNGITDLRVRKGPGRDYCTLPVTLYYGDTVVIQGISKDEEWYLIQFNKFNRTETGWVIKIRITISDPEMLNSLKTVEDPVEACKYTPTP